MIELVVMERGFEGVTCVTFLIYVFFLQISEFKKRPYLREIILLVYFRFSFCNGVLINRLGYLGEKRWFCRCSVCSVYPIWENRRDV